MKTTFVFPREPVFVKNKAQPIVKFNPVVPRRIQRGHVWIRPRPRTCQADIALLSYSFKTRLSFTFVKK